MKQEEKTNIFSDKLSKEQIENFQKELNEGKIKNIQCPYCSNPISSIPHSALKIVCPYCNKEIDFRKSIPQPSLQLRELPVKKRNKAIDFLTAFCRSAGATITIKNWLDEVLKLFTPQSLQLAIVDDDDLWTKMPVNLKIQTRRIKWAFNEVTIDEILQWIQERDNALYNVIIDAPMIQEQPIGIFWIHEQINDIKNNNHFDFFK